jgi:hypothetical protein
MYLLFVAATYPVGFAFGVELVAELAAVLVAEWVVGLVVEFAVAVVEVVVVVGVEIVSLKLINYICIFIRVL